MNKDIIKLFVYKDYSIKQVLKVIDSGAKGIAIVVDKEQHLLGTITDGDIRRALLSGISLDDDLDKIIHKNPTYATENMKREEIKYLFIKNVVKEIPIVDDNKKVIDLISIRDILIPEGKENQVIIMAGGLGTRLKELTEEIPKPMLKVGQDPILHHIINNFKQYGYNDILMSVNYKGEIIENYFQDGVAYGVKIKYIRENKRLGTAGGIKLGQEYLKKPFFVINGDIFTNLNVDNMMSFHKENGFDMTIGVREYSFQIPYGIIKNNGKMVNGVQEKPTVNCLISAGVYCLNPNLLEYIPKDTYFEITDLINICVEKGLKVGNYEIKEYWMDIGKIEDYNKVNEDIVSFI